MCALLFYVHASEENCDSSVCMHGNYLLMGGLGITDCFMSIQMLNEILGQ